MKNNSAAEKIRKYRVKVVGLDNPSKRLRFLNLDTGSFGYMELGEVSMYDPNDFTSYLMPKEVERLFGQEITVYVCHKQGSERYYSHREVMLEDYQKVHIGSSQICRVVGYFKDGLIMQCSNNSSVVRCKVSDISVAPISNLKKQFPIGTEHRIKIIGKNRYDHIIYGSIKELNKDQLSNYYPGRQIVGRIAQRLKTNDGYIIEVSPMVYGILDSTKTYPLDSNIQCIVTAVRSDKLKLEMLDIDVND